jgi:hypothetical protein
VTVDGALDAPSVDDPPHATKTETASATSASWSARVVDDLLRQNLLTGRS